MKRAMAPGAAADTYTRYEVLRPLPIEASEIAPAFGQPGGGIQYRILNELDDRRVTVQNLIDQRYIRQIK